MQGLYIVMHVGAVSCSILHNWTALALLLPFCMWLHAQDCDDS